MPENQLDHINRIRDDNKIKNLREASIQCNNRNCCQRPNTSSGIKGVSYHKQANKWAAQIKTNRKNNYLGYFKDKLDAAKARWLKEKELNWKGCDSTSPAYLYIKEHDPEFIEQNN
jgi:hypothetical protein